MEFAGEKSSPPASPVTFPGQAGKGGSRSPSGQPHKCREKPEPQGAAVCLQAQGEHRGPLRGVGCWSLPMAGEAAQHLPPARLKSDNYSCSIKADYHPSKPNSIIISMLLLYFCNWKAIIRLPPSHSLFLIHLQVMLL